MGNLVTMSSYLTEDKTKQYLQKMLGERTNEFVTSLSTMVGSNPKLNECDRASLMGCALKSVSMNLPFDQNLGFAWVIPYGTSEYDSDGKQVTKAQFQMGAKGFTQLAQRSGQIIKIGDMEVREGEFMGRDMFGEPIIQWLPENKRITQKIIGYMAGFVLANGFQKCSYWSIDEVKSHAERYSQAYRYAIKKGQKDSPWVSEFDKMARKTVLKHLLSKYAPLSIELQQAMKYDQAIIEIDDNGQENVVYMDNPKTDTITKKKITAKQVRELANMISEDPKKLDILKSMGYETEDIQNIYSDDYDNIINELRGD